MVTPGVYQHYKGKLYRVLFVAKNSANNADPLDEDVVVYVALYGDGRVSVRPAREFIENVHRPWHRIDQPPVTRFAFVSP